MYIKLNQQNNDFLIQIQHIAKLLGKAKTFKI